MPPQRANAAHIAPYLTHLITHHGQLTLVPPDNNGRRRKAKENRYSPREEPVRFNSGPTPAPSSARRIRRPSRTEQPSNNLLDGIPDYPPPSFQEAISSPSISVCPSTTTLGQFTTPQPSRHGYNSDSDSESDDVSLDIVDTGGVTPSQGAATASLQSPTTRRGRGILDSDPDDMPSSSNVRPHRRHLSLSPLRTLFPSRNVRESSSVLSAQSTPAHSLAFSRSSPFFRSTTSLRNLTSATPLPPQSPSSPPSIRSESFLGPRRFFSHKGKERATSEALDSWEIVESELPADFALPPPPQEASSLPTAPVSTPPTLPASVTSGPIHPLSERDRRTKSRNRAPPIVPSATRERERDRRVVSPPPSSSPAASVPVIPGAGPPIVTLRMKKPPPPPPPKKKPQPASSPLRATDRSCVLPELDLDRAMRTPLPLTPVAGSPASPYALSVEPGSPAVDEVRRVPSPAPRTPSGGSEPANPSVDAEGQHHHPHHYPGRPLPRRPRLVVDSTYGAHPDFPQNERPPTSVPEGLLIDLDDAETPTAPGLPMPIPASPPLNQPRPAATAMERASSASSVDLVASTTPRPEFMEVTDLDVLLARLENDQRDGRNYDAMLFLSEFIGPAMPVRPGGAAPWRSTTATKTSVLLTGFIEVQRRRTTKDGRVKLKLALLGTAVDRCGICITQFRKAQRARLSDACRHAFHERCLARWIARSRTCPMCRIALDLDTHVDGLEEYMYG